jgi:hypothetical protein
MTEDCHVPWEPGGEIPPGDPTTVGPSEPRLPRTDQVTRPARLDMILALAAVSRPYGYAVASRAWTRRPRPRTGSYEEHGGEAGRGRAELHQEALIVRTGFRLILAHV